MFRYLNNSEIKDRDLELENRKYYRRHLGDTHGNKPSIIKDKRHVSRRYRRYIDENKECYIIKPSSAQTRYYEEYLNRENFLYDPFNLELFSEIS